MKKTILLFLCLLPVAMHAQDTAQAIVDRYLRLLNYEDLPKDSLLVIGTEITYRDGVDTLNMLRYYQTGGMMRVEVRYADTLLTGLCSNGTTRFRTYSPTLEWWDNTDTAQWRESLEPYDFRGPLYNWRNRGIKLIYLGISRIDGHELQTVRVEEIDRYVRLYYFDPASGLLVLIIERDELPEGSRKAPFRNAPIDFKFIHEYMPIGNSLVPSVESYSREGTMTIMRSVMHFESRNNLLFNQD